MSYSTRVLTIGTFDLAHFGHVDFLKQCARLGEVIVGINTDKFVNSFKASPIMNQVERRHAIEALGYRTLYNNTAGKRLIQLVGPNILAVGSDWARKDYLKQIDVDQDWLDKHHITLAYIPYVQSLPISSTEIKRRIRER